MERRGVRQGSQSSPAAAKAVQLPDITTALVELQRGRRELEELKAQKKERQQKLGSLNQRADELQEEIKKLEEFNSSFDLTLKNEEATRAVEKESREALEKQAEVERLQEKLADLKGRKQELQHQVQRLRVYPDYMEQVLKMTKFKNVEELTRHLENLLHFKDKFLQKENEMQEQADQLKKELLTVEDQHRLVRLDKSNQLSQLHTELEKTHSEALKWESKWNHILETSVEKTLQLGQIKLAVFNLYEIAGGSIEGEEGVDINDTEAQLDKVKMFMRDIADIVKQYQTSSERCSDGKNKRQSQKATKKAKKKSSKTKVN